MVEAAVRPETYLTNGQRLVQVLLREDDGRLLVEDTVSGGTSHLAADQLVGELDPGRLDEWRVVTPDGSD